MRARWIVVVGALSFAVPSLTVAAGVVLPSTVTLLEGRPPAGGGATGVAILPGTVILPGEGPAAQPAMDQLKLELTDAYRLGELATRSVRTMYFVVGQERALESAPPGMEVRLKLVAFDDKTASYTVSLAESGRPLASPTVSVARGGRAVVGSRDGAEAPYLFLVVEPAGVGSATVKEFERPLPRLIARVAPEYPEQARKDRVQGLVVMEITIDREGRPTDVKVLDSADERLTAAAVEAVRQWRYEPPLVDGKPASVKGTATVRFQLQ
jgi:TonB family protein